MRGTSKINLAMENLFKVRDRLVTEDIKMGRVYSLAYQKPWVFYLEHSVEEAAEILKTEAGII